MWVWGANTNKASLAGNRLVEMVADGEGCDDHGDSVVEPIKRRPAHRPEGAGRPALEGTL